jgi:LasA protease
MRSKAFTGWMRAAALLLATLVPIIACNFPLRRSAEGSFTELRQTLTALAPTLQGNATAIPIPTGLAGSPVFEGLQTTTPPPQSGDSPAPPAIDESGAFYTYYAQPGDTLEALALRFDVDPGEITSSLFIPTDSLIPAGQVLTIPNVLGSPPYPSALLPDSEAIYSHSAVDFRLAEFVLAGGGYLSSYEEIVDGEQYSGIEIVEKVALENSVNPRLLLAFLEFRSQWVFGQPAVPTQIDYPIGFYVPGYRGLYNELLLTATQLGIGYYGWRAGTLTTLSFRDGRVARISPGLNAGSVALQALFSKFYSENDWVEALYGEGSFSQLYQLVFPDPWNRSATAGPIFPPGLEQPPLELPFLPAERWSFTGGPHLTWNSGSPRGAVDFSPVTGQPPCAPTDVFITASAAGVVTRAANNLVAIDLDGDGFEGTGWVLIHLHLTGIESLPPGTRVEMNTPLGHPSCEGGKATGTHVHIARKYNGEWLPAGDPLPFVLSGWEVRAGSRSYEGLLVKGDQIVSANPGGSGTSVIVR